MNIKTTIRNLSPFNARQDMPASQFVLKKLLAFFLIYLVAAVAGEAIIIGTLCAMGYDPLNGIMPTGFLAGLLPNYGMILFVLRQLSIVRRSKNSACRRWASAPVFSITFWAVFWQSCCWLPSPVSAACGVC